MFWIKKDAVNKFYEMKEIEEKERYRESLLWEINENLLCNIDYDIKKFEEYIGGKLSVEEIATLIKKEQTRSYEKIKEIYRDYKGVISFALAGVKNKKDFLYWAINETYNYRKREEEEKIEHEKKKKKVNKMVKKLKSSKPKTKTNKKRNSPKQPLLKEEKIVSRSELLDL